MLQRMLELPMPVVGVANGPAIVHSEYLLLSDIHIASQRATYADYPRPAFGITGGDGVQVVREEVAERHASSGCSGLAGASTPRPPWNGAS